MSPSKKKKAAKKSPAKKSAAKAKAPAAKKAKKAAKKAAAKKTAKAKAKKTAKKSASKKAAKAPAKKKAAKAPAKKAAAKKPPTKAAKSPAKAAGKPGESKKAAAKKAAAPSPVKTPVKTPAKARVKGKSEAKDAKSGKRARAKKLVTPTGPRHPKLGFKWACFACAAKFYDLGKEEPICPKCETDQRERPPEDAKHVVEAPKPKVVRPMAQLLDDEEPAASRHEEPAASEAAMAKNEMFDESESDAAGLDFDDTDLADGASEPPEIDVL